MSQMGARWVVVASVALGPAQVATAEPDHYARCAACHLDDGAGVPGLFPPLAGHVHQFFASTDGRNYLARLVLGGANDAVDVLGVRYAGAMPAVVADLSDAEIAALLNDLVRRFGAAQSTSGRPFSSLDVANARAAGTLSPAQRNALRRRALAKGGLADLHEPGTRPPATPDADPSATGQAHGDWMLHCQGCHGADGALSMPDMPALKGQVAGYLGESGGRTRLVRVPGVTNASLSDARLARLLNWMLATFDAEHLPDDFDAFTGEEVGALRGRPPALPGSGDDNETTH